ncbi:MAG TPA: VTT domain-containing protein [Candidatus Saccharimonadales bacterium]|nr:VTT domain-containing protein [Candidatus Saccharimonadales bacterium]
MFDVTHLIETGGLLLIGLMVFAESGIMVGLFLPGDTLLLSAGVLAATGKLDIVTLTIVITIAAIAGDNVGFFIGKHLGPRLFRKKDGVIFRKEYIDKAEKFYEKYGARAMLVEHFIPIIRSFAPVTAGAGKMNYGLFFVCNTIGDIAWAVSFTLFGFYVGSKIPHIDKYIEPAILAVILVFTVPALYRVLSDPRIRAAIKSKFKRS